jgi:hypothetical protein
LISIPLSILLGQERGLQLWGSPGEQKNFETAIFVLALLCIPLMLIPKPLLEIRALNKKKALKQQQDN